MSNEEQKKTPPTDYWKVLPSSDSTGLFVVDPEGRHSAYVKGDGGVHVWYYSDQKEDMTDAAPKRTRYGDGEDDFYDEDAEYRMIDIDDEILRLLALRETAIRHFEERGCKPAREEWFYGKPLGTDTMGKHIPIELETMPARSSDEQAAIFASFREEERVHRIQFYAEIGVAEEDIDKVTLIHYEGDSRTSVHLSDGRTWTAEKDQHQPKELEQ